MKRIIAITVGLLLIVTASEAISGVIGDIDNNGKIDLTEAIYALQVPSGMKVQSRVDHYDITDYFWIPGGSYTYKFVNQFQIGDIETVEISNTKINEYSVISAHSKRSEHGFMKEIEEYFTLSNGKLLALGSKELLMFQEPIFYEPPITIGANVMTIGDVFATFYKSKSSMGMYTYFINKFQLIGVENVTLPFGTITDCLKYISEKTDGTKELLYFAKNIGLIKTQKISNTGFIQSEVKELLYAKIGDTTFPTAGHFCSGIWTATEDEVQVGSSTFNFFQIVKNTKHTGLLIFSSDASNTITFNNPLAVTSEDGLSYNADPDVYGVNPPQVTLTLSNGTLSGTFQIQQGFGHGSPEEETPPVRIYTITGTCN